MRSLGAIWLATPLVAAEKILPDDERLSYIGRFAPSADGSVQCSAWGGTQVAARFKGTSVSALLTGGGSSDRFLTLIDGEPHGDPFIVTPDGGCADFPSWADSDGDKCSKIVKNEWCAYAEDFKVKGVSALDACCGCGGGTKDPSDMTSYTLAKGLAAGEHTVALWKVTEDVVQAGRAGAACFGGFSANEFLAAPPARTRRLEFIGDSDTAGYCADGSSSGGDKEKKTENTYETWASKIALAFDADFVEQAVSGFGVRSGTPSVTPLLKNALPWDDSTPWDFTSWVPDAVVMLIGPNDNKPKSDKFKTAYREMMDAHVSHYGGAKNKPKIIHVCAGSMNGFDPCESIQAVSGEFNSDHSDGWESHYTSITQAHWKEINNHNAYKGCDDHYSSKGHQVVADDIVPQIRQIMGWDSVAVV